MTEIKKTTVTPKWTTLQAYTLAVVCLLLGIAGGWLFRGSQSASSPAPETAAAAPPSSTGMSGGNAQPSPEQMKQMADTQAQLLLEKLKSDPTNADLLASVGNVYYDTQQYPTAINYYQQALKSQPANTGIRTDMATAYWYTGDADTAISEFKKSLSYDPNKANTLFNLGIVEWQGKMDINDAVATWQKLLDTNPNYENKDKVVELIAQARKHTGVKPGTAAKPLQQ
jgi:cytochrome c-type biogenesis protein CcmH/NrfG